MNNGFIATEQAGEYITDRPVNAEEIGFNEKKQRYKIDQLVLQDNQPVSVTTRQWVKRWLRQAQQRPSE